MIPLGEITNGAIKTVDDLTGAACAILTDDLQHSLTFRLSAEQPARFRFRWQGGLEVAALTPASLHAGSSSGGVRVLDFTRDGEGWVLSLEGDGGGRGEVLLRGEAVEAQGGSVSPLEDGIDTFLLTVDFPGEARRVTRIVHLRPVR